VWTTGGKRWTVLAHFFLSICSPEIIRGISWRFGVTSYAPLHSIIAPFRASRGRGRSRSAEVGGDSRRTVLAHFFLATGSSK